MRLTEAAEPANPVNVTVTFLRMDRPPAVPARRLPEGAVVEVVERPTVKFYRYLYNTVGDDHLWWLRRVMPDADLAAILADPGVTIHVLYQRGAPAGFYELDRRNRPDANLSYFGLLPHAVGRGLGTAFLRQAIDTAWSEKTRYLTVNTCTADNPRALPGYLRAGFHKTREIRECWAIPARLNLPVPAHLTAAADSSNASLHS